MTTVSLVDVSVDQLKNQHIRAAAAMLEDCGASSHASRRTLPFTCPVHGCTVSTETAWTLPGWVSVQVCDEATGCAFSHDTMFDFVSGPNPFDGSDDAYETADVVVLPALPSEDALGDQT